MKRSLPTAAQLFALALAALAQSPQASALGGFGASGPLELLPRSLKTFTAHPFGEPAGLSLYQARAESLEDAIANAVRPELHPLIGLRFETAATPLAREISFHIGGVAVCGTGMRAHALRDGRLLILGTIPALDPAVRSAPRTPDAWPDQELAVQRAADALDGEATLKKARPCLEIVNGEPLPVWDLQVTHAGLPYNAIADAYEARRVENAYFDAVAGTAKVYPSNANDLVKADVALPDLLGDGTLTSPLLRSVIPAIFTRIVEPTHVFDFADEDPRFVELSSYAHAQVHLDFVTKYGFEWYGPAPILIKNHVAPGGTRNNALFIPGDASANALPEIQIDDGDGKDLQSLGLDGDVVSHELGHHVIYRTLRTTSGQSLALHEGLADFLAFARTGDPCLGETICPAGSGACIVPGQCLRTAATNVKYGDANWEGWKRVRGGRLSLGHLHGQLVSGLLWDLRVNGDIAADELTQLTIKAVSFFKFDSGFRDWLLALFMADAELFQGRYFAVIKARADGRNLTEFMTGIAPGLTLPPLEGRGAETSAANVGPNGLPTATEPEKKETKGDENPFKCGVAFGGGGGTATAIALILSLLLPLLVAAAPQPAKARAKKPQKKPSKKAESKAS